jgi:hypothetical protein
LKERTWYDGVERKESRVKMFRSLQVKSDQIPECFWILFLWWKLKFESKNVIFKFGKPGPPEKNEKISKKLSFSMRNPVLNLILVIFRKTLPFGLPGLLIRAWRTRISEQNFYFTSIYMLTGDRKHEENLHNAN